MKGPTMKLKIGWEEALKNQCKGHKGSNIVRRIKELTEMISRGEAIVK